MGLSIAAVLFCMARTELYSIIENVARSWADPEYVQRADAAEATVQLDNRFTAEAVAFAVNQQMHVLRAKDLSDWIGPGAESAPSRVIVVNPGNVPLAGLQDFLAVILIGHRYHGKMSSRSPHLLSEFADDLQRHGADLDATFGVALPELESTDAVIASGFDDTVDSLASEAMSAGVPRRRILTRGQRFSVAVIGEAEPEHVLDGLAEDILLHEGLGCRNVAIVWAPSGESPDDLLSAMARFRAVFPAHPSTISGLKIPIAYYRATDLPHAYADDGSFLVSKGEPEVQLPAHVRWTEYDDLSDVVRWLDTRRSRIQLVSASRRSREALAATSIPTVAPGDAQRPELGWKQDDTDVVDFLRQL